MSKKISLLRMMDNAKETPSEKCMINDDHDFYFVAFGDSTEFSMMYYRCKHCQEVIVNKSERTGINKEYWQ